MDDTNMTLVRREALQAVAENQVTGTDDSFRAGGAGEPNTQAVAWLLKQGYASYRKRGKGQAASVLVTPAGRAALATDAERPQRKASAKAPATPPISASTPATNPPFTKA